MKRVLTRTGFTDAVEVRARNWKRWVLDPVQGALGRKGMFVALSTPGGSASMWANRANSCETIMTIDRLDAVQRCMETVLAERVPGDSSK